MNRSKSDRSMADWTLREIGTAGLAHKAMVRQETENQIHTVIRARAGAQALRPWDGHWAEVQRVWGAGVTMASGASGYSRAIARERRRAQARVLAEGRKAAVVLESWAYAPAAVVGLGPDWLPGDALLRIPGDALCCAVGGGRREWGCLVRVPATRGKRQGRSPVMVSLGSGERYEYLGGAVRSDTVEVSIFLGRLGYRVARRSRGVRVSSTSLEDSAAAGRAAVVGYFTPRFDLSTIARWIRSGWAPFVRRAELIAARAASASLGEGAGLSGRNEGKRLAWCSSIDAEESELTGGQYLLRLVTLQIQRDAEHAARWQERFDGQRKMARGLSSVVRRARRASLSGVRPQDWRPVSRRFRRLHRVLCRVALGESLELACESAGFAWESGHGRSKALIVALESSGVLRESRLALGRAGVSIPSPSESGGIGAACGLLVHRPASKPDRRPYHSGGVGVGVSVPVGASVTTMQLAARYARQRRVNDYVNWWRSVKLGK